MNINKKNITLKDISNVCIRSTFLQGSWNFERMQALGFCYSIIPIINKFYSNNSIKRKQAIKRHLEFFNTHPYMVGPILGIIIAMEEQKANGMDITDNAINSIKVGLMGPLAGIGDPIFWGTIRPILAALGAGLSMTGNIIGPIIFFISFNTIRILVLYLGIKYGYNKGMDLIKKIDNNLLKKITEGASILGLFIMGALVNKWTSINIPIVISSIDKQNQINIITIQDICNQILPSIIPLLLTTCCMWLLKKKINPLIIITFIFIFSIIGNYYGLITN